MAFSDIQMMEIERRFQQHHDENVVTLEKRLQGDILKVNEALEDHAKRITEGVATVGIAVTTVKNEGQAETNRLKAFGETVKQDIEERVKAMQKSGQELMDKVNELRGAVDEMVKKSQTTEASITAMNVNDAEFKTRVKDHLENTAQKEQEFKQQVNKFIDDTAAKHTGQWTDLNNFAIRLRTEVSEMVAKVAESGGSGKGGVGVGGTKASGLCNGKETSISKLPEQVDKATFLNWREALDLHVETFAEFKHVSQLLKVIRSKQLPFGQKVSVWT